MWPWTVSLILAAPPIQVDADFPGGNIVVDRIDGDDLHVRQDPRDTDGYWFYWCLRLRGAAGRTVRLHFPRGPVFTVRGPAASFDAGTTWRWLGPDSIAGETCTITVPDGCDVVYVGMTIPYVEADLNRFLTAHADPALRRETLCRTPAGRDVPLLRVGAHDDPTARPILITARHHCCESMASFALEGLIAAVLADPALRSRLALWVVPFVDTDGVAGGDQGKNRHPRDHNRDYDGDSLYAETAALRRLAPTWAPGGWDLMLDLHCPYIRGATDHYIYLVGSQNERVAAEQRRFAAAVEAAREGPIPFLAADLLPFGTAWNTPTNFGAGTSFCRWGTSLPGTHLATTIEIPYAWAHEVEVTPETARAFGADLVRGMGGWLGF